MKAIIIDDNPLERERLLRMIKESDELSFAGEADNAADGAMLIKRTQPDVVFLDVELPDLSGFEMIRRSELPARSKQKIVIYTAHQKYMIDTLRSVAFDILLKPLDPKEFKTVERRLADNRDTEIDYRTLGDASNELSELTTSRGLRHQPQMGDVCFFEYSKTERRWEGITAQTDQRVKLRLGIAAADILALHPRYVQVSRNCIVNTDYLQEVSGGKCHFLPPFDHLKPIPIARNYKGNIAFL